MNWNSKIMLILDSGPSENFCKHKADGKYANPKNPQQFFTCTNKVGSLCQLCASTLIYKQECDRCLRPSDSCTTSKPETRPTNAIPRTTRAPIPSGPKCK